MSIHFFVLPSAPFTIRHFLESGFITKKVVQVSWYISLMVSVHERAKMGQKLEYSELTLLTGCVGLAREAILTLALMGLPKSRPWQLL